MNKCWLQCQHGESDVSSHLLSTLQLAQAKTGTTHKICCDRITGLHFLTMDDEQITKKERIIRDQGIACNTLASYYVIKIYGHFIYANYTAS